MTVSYDLEQLVSGMTLGHAPASLLSKCSPQSLIEAVVADEARDRGLVVQPARGHGLVGRLVADDDGGGLEMEPQSVYGIAPLSRADTAQCAADMVALIAEHGRGRVWFLLRPVHYVIDGEMLRTVLVPTEHGGTAVHALMRSFYCHDRLSRRVLA